MRTDEGLYGGVVTARFPFVLCALNLLLGPPIPGVLSIDHALRFRVLASPLRLFHPFGCFEASRSITKRAVLAALRCSRTRVRKAKVRAKAYPFGYREKSSPKRRTCRAAVR